MDRIVLNISTRLKRIKTHNNGRQFGLFANYHLYKSDQRQWGSRFDISFTSPFGQKHT